MRSYFGRYLENTRCRMRSAQCHAMRRRVAPSLESYLDSGIDYYPKSKVSAYKAPCLSLLFKGAQDPIEVRLDGLKWDLSCVCGSLRWGAGSTRGAAIPICAKNENREKREKRSQGICGFWESQAKGYSGFGNPKPRDMRGLGIPSQGICGVWGSQAKGYTAL